MKKRIFIIVSFIVAYLLPTPVNGQDIIALYEQTRKFAEKFMYGEHDRNVGLKFGWKYEENNWKPVGNGFVFLSETLKIYHYDTSEGVEAETVLPQWYISPDFAKNNPFAALEPALFARQDLVQWVDGQKREDYHMNIDLLKQDTDSVPGLIIPAKIEMSGPIDNVEDLLTFMAINDSNNNDLVFRFVNLLPNRIQVDINNVNYPASPVGWRTLATSREGNENVETTVAAINMDGHLILPPYSFSVFIFPTKPHKGTLPKNLLL